MLPQHAPAPQSPRRIGVGIDTSRYGHYAAFLRDDLQPAADELAFAESAAGYALLHQRLQGIVRTLRTAVLRRPSGRGRTLCRQLAPLPASTGHAPRRQVRCSRPVGSHHLLRRSATQQELPRRPLRQSEVRSRRGPRRRTLRPEPRSLAVTSRCHSNSASSARSPDDCRPSSANAPASSTSSIICSALTFPELALLTKDLAAGWVLELMHRYPTRRASGPGHARRSRRHPLSARRSASRRCSNRPTPPSPR